MATTLTQFRPQSRADGCKYICYLSVFTILLAFTAPFSAYDTKALATCSKSQFVITSPNMMFVPEPHINTEELRAHADGHFGMADCFQWLQDYAKDFEYAVCVPRQEFHRAPDHFSWAWYTPTLEDFGTVLAADRDDVPRKLKQEQSLGLLSLLNIAQGRYDTWKKIQGNKKDMVPRLLLTLRHSVYKLMQEPLPWHNIMALIAQAQRLFLDIITFLDYCKIVQPRITWPDVIPHPVCTAWMGCFTRDSRVCNELFCAGVPVWYIHSDFSITTTTIIEKPITYTFPDHIICVQFSVPRKMVQPFALLYAGPGGKDRHTKTRYFYECTPFLATVTSISGSSQAASGSSQAAKAPTVTQKKKEARRELLLQSSTQGWANPSECFLSHHKYPKLSTSWH